MTIYDLYLEYEQTSKMLRGRIKELQEMSKATDNVSIQHSIDVRIKPLESMYRSTREICKVLNNYYESKQAGVGTYGR